MSRKPKVDSVLDRVSPTQRDRITRWLFEAKLDSRAVRERCRREFQLPLTPAQFGKLRRQLQQDRLLDTIIRSIRSSNQVARTFRENAAHFYDSLVQMAGRIAFDECLDRDGVVDPRTLYGFTRLVMAAFKRRMDAEARHLARPGAGADEPAAEPVAITHQ